MVNTLTVELADEGTAEQFVRYLDERELESAKRVDCDDVVVRVADAPGESRLAVLVALEGWLLRQRDALVVVRVGRRSHRLRPHPGAAHAGTS